MQFINYGVGSVEDFITLMIIVCLLSVAGCDDGSGLFGPGEGALEYTLDCRTGPNCINAQSVYTETINNVIKTYCHWGCADYKGHYDNGWKIVFAKRPGECWKKISEEITSDLCP